MSEDRINKSISFNKKDEYDLSLLQHAERLNPLKGKKRNFSKYVKKLIEDDMNKLEKKTEAQPAELSKPKIDNYTAEAMKGFL